MQLSLKYKVKHVSRHYRGNLLKKELKASNYTILTN